MSDTGWVVVAVLGVWAILFVSFSYDTYEANKTKREVLKTLQVIAQHGSQEDTKAFIDEFIDKKEQAEKGNEGN